MYAKATKTRLISRPSSVFTEKEGEKLNKSVFNPSRRFRISFSNDNRELVIDRQSKIACIARIPARVRVFFVESNRPDCVIS